MVYHSLPCNAMVYHGILRNSIVFIRDNRQFNFDGVEGKRNERLGK